MKNQINNGGDALRMSLLDWFAAQAMASLLTQPNINAEAMKLIPIAAYQIARKMMAERGGEKNV